MCLQIKQSFALSVTSVHSKYRYRMSNYNAFTQLAAACFAEKRVDGSRRTAPSNTLIKIHALFACARAQTPGGTRSASSSPTRPAPILAITVANSSFGGFHFSPSSNNHPVLFADAPENFGERADMGRKENPLHTAQKPRCP